MFPPLAWGKPLLPFMLIRPNEPFKETCDLAFRLAFFAVVLQVYLAAEVQVSPPLVLHKTDILLAVSTTLHVRFLFRKSASSSAFAWNSETCELSLVEHFA
jgi:hypothetical protein